jgi:hypothetical protein
VKALLTYAVRFIEFYYYFSTVKAYIALRIAQMYTNNGLNSVGARIGTESKYAFRVVAWKTGTSIL